MGIALSALIFSAPAAFEQQASPPANPQQSEHGTIQPPIPTHEPEAQFPVAAQISHTTGYCLLTVIVDVQGKSQSPQIVKCSDNVFAENSLTAASEYRFKPAVDQNGKAVPVKITIEVNFRMYGGNGPLAASGLDPAFKYIMITPTDLAPPGPDAHGVYPMSKLIEAPAIKRFADRDFTITAMRFSGSATCDINITISPRGKPSDPAVQHCDQQALEGPATASLLDSQFKPGKLNGKAVPVRVDVHLIYGGYAPSTAAPLR